LQGLKEAGLVERRCAQRLDSMQIMGLVSRMSRLECVRETLRLALQSIAESSGRWERPGFWKEYWERYVETKLDYRSEAGALKEKMDQAGRDGWELLDWIKKLKHPELEAGSAVQILERVWQENF